GRVPDITAGSRHTGADSGRAAGALTPSRAGEGGPVQVYRFPRARSRVVVGLDRDGGAAAAVLSVDVVIVREVASVETRCLLVVCRVGSADPEDVPGTREQRDPAVDRLFRPRAAARRRAGDGKPVAVLGAVTIHVIRGGPGAGGAAQEKQAGGQENPARRPVPKPRQLF